VNSEFTPEIVKHLIFTQGATPQLRSEAISWLVKESDKNNPDAIYVLATLVDAGVLTLAAKDISVKQHVLSLMQRAAVYGNPGARAYVNNFCRERYENNVRKNIIPDKTKKRLIGFDGKPIKINRRGILTPVDAVLTFEDGINVLTLDVPLIFNFSYTPANSEIYKKAVFDGIMQWQGEYEVFGGQRLRVKVNVTETDSVFDGVYVIAVTQECKDNVQDLVSKLHIDEENQGYRTVVKTNRSFALLGTKWKTTSRKMICMQSEDLKFDDYDELCAVAKHEFGHVLGLGDLYRDTGSALEGVPEGTYKELDCYHISSRIYNLVMCDHHADVTNNDIEMVVLAFSKNKMQLFQKFRRNKKISEALGKGN